MDVKISRILWSIAVVIITGFILSIIKKFLIKKVAYTSKDTQHKNTFLGMLFNVLQYLVVVASAFIILSINGVNVTSLLAGLGIVATIVGLALQDTLKDVIAGINIYNNNFYKVGDVVVYNGERCEVKYFSARVTKLRSFVTYSTYTINNSCVTAIEKVKEGHALFITFDMSDDKKKIDKAFLNACERIKDDELITNPVYFDIVKFDDNGVVYAIAFEAPPRDVLADARMYRVLYDEFARIKLAPSTREGIKIKNDPWDK